LSRYASLKQKKFRDQFNLYIISGFNAVETAILSKNIQVEALLIRSDQLEQLKKFKTSSEILVYELNSKQFNQLSNEKNPQGIALIAHKPDTRFTRFDTKFHIFIYLDQVNDPGNLGTIIRTAAWFGVYHILLSPNSADPYQPKTVRSSVGITSHIRIYEDVEPEQLRVLKQDAQFKLIGASAHGKMSLEKFKLNPKQKYGLIFGSEAHGITDQIEDILDEQVNIPITGIGESLNLAASTAIVLFHYQNQVKFRAN
jgi:TrmH family RNA methyltransferase